MNPARTTPRPRGADPATVPGVEESSSERYRELFEQVRVPIVAFEAETLRVVHVNAATEGRFGYGAAELRAGRITDLHAEPADVQSAGWLRASEPPARSRPFTYRCKDGRLRQVEVSLGDAPVNGRPLRIATIVDVTDRLHAERLQHRLLARVIEVQERERRRIARELHDHMGQHVAAQALLIRSLSRRVRGARAQEQLRELRESCETIGGELRELAFELRPAALDDFGIAGALEVFARRWSERNGIPAEFAAKGLQTLRIDAGIETAIYRIAQEAFTNVQKHARAKHVHVALTRARGNLVLVIRDDGRGMSRGVKRPAPATSGSGFGLLSMRERSEAIGGRLTIRSRPQLGTTIRVTVPLPAPVGE